MDLNGRIAVRTRAADRSGTTEVVLSRSAYTGTPVRFNVNREYLGRAIRLGCHDIEVADAASPIVCRSGDRTYACQPLDEDTAIEPSDDVVRIEAPERPTIPSVNTPERKVHVSQDDNRDVEQVARYNRPPTPEAATPTGLAALITEAEALHEALGQARSRARQLVVALRKQRRREKLVTSTLASLRELRLQDVAG